MLKVHIRPKWGRSPISEVKPALVQQWLRGLDVAPKTKRHIKALMHQLFEKAMLWELIPIDRNPMQLVRVKGISKRTKKPVVLTADQCAALISSLPEPYRTMVTVAICTGLRVSEILALRWSRIDFDRLTLFVRVKAVNGRVGLVTTECSEDDLPLDPDFAAVLKAWKKSVPEHSGRLGFSESHHRSLLPLEPNPAGLYPSHRGEARAEANRLAHVSAHIPRLARCDRRTRRRSAKTDASCTHQHDDEWLRQCADGIEA